ncbi:MAG: hypothetical protein GX443_15240 [Deltaproteobacteria bacterium]|nr:hypothetical protein [Deltaproteobacteria bacterium]
MDETINRLEIRCPKLGGEVTFGYCRREEGRLPCRRIIRCWQSRFPVETFLLSQLSREERDQWVRQHPRERMDLLLESIERTRKEKDRSP